MSLRISFGKSRNGMARQIELMLGASLSIVPRSEGAVEGRPRKLPYVLVAGFV